MRREFLIKIIRKLGFGEHFITLIGEMKNIVQFSILGNGPSRPFFLVEQGILRKDLLSPYLFIMVSEILGTNLLSLVSQHEIMGIKPTSTLSPEVL